MGTQKNRLNETVLLSTQNLCLNCLVRKYLQFYAQIYCLSTPLLYTYFQIQGIHEEYQGLPIHICVIKVSHLVRTQGTYPKTIPALTVCLLVSSLITLVNGLDSDQALQNVRPDLDPNHRFR